MGDGSFRDRCVERRNRLFVAPAEEVGGFVFVYCVTHRRDRADDSSPWNDRFVRCLRDLDVYTDAAGGRRVFVVVFEDGR